MFIFFFFKQKTAYEMRISDWSSDVCSSDLNLRRLEAPQGWSSRRQPLVKAGGQEKERMTNEQLATNRESARPVRQAEREEMLDLRRIWQAARRNWLLITIVSIAALAATAVLYMSTNPTYVATAQLMVERIPDDVLTPEIGRAHV